MNIILKWLLSSLAHVVTLLTYILEVSGLNLSPDFGYNDVESLPQVNYRMRLWPLPSLSFPVHYLLLLSICLHFSCYGEVSQSFLFQQLFEWIFKLQLDIWMQTSDFSLTYCESLHLFSYIKPQWQSCMYMCIMSPWTLFLQTALLLMLLYQCLAIAEVWKNLDIILALENVYWLK